MTLLQIVYASQPFGYDDATLGGVLLDARRCNKRDDITGALVCRRDIYLQLLEGPPDAVASTYERIVKDDRHANIVQLSKSQPAERMFGAWDMLHDPAKSWLWSAKDVSDGVLERLTPAQVHDVFAALSAKMLNV